MTILDDDLDSALTECIRQWNIAEVRIKKAEHVRGKEVVASAIFELRYAGRKLVDAFHLALTHDLHNEPEIHKKVAAYIADATEDCVKAKHDAIDAMVNFVTIWFDEKEKEVGLKSLQTYFPDYIGVTSKIFDLQQKIAESRGDRTVTRDPIYDEIEKDGYDEILGLFERMRRSDERVTATVRKEHRSDIIWKVVAIVGAIGTLIAVIQYFSAAG